MRPRVFPAEDVAPRGVVQGPEVASMRPRVFPAEDRLMRVFSDGILDASMRPRVFPAEDEVFAKSYRVGTNLLQ